MEWNGILQFQYKAVDERGGHLFSRERTEGSTHRATARERNERPKGRESENKRRDQRRERLPKAGMIELQKLDSTGDFKKG